MSLKVLRCVCFFCSRLLVSTNQLDIESEDPKVRFNNVYSQCRTRRRCSRCDANQPNYTRQPFSIRADWSEVTFDNEEERAFATSPLTARKVLSIFHCMDTEEVLALGFRVTHPRDFLMEVVVVPSPIARPAVHANEGSRAKSQDDLTLKLQDVNKRCIEIRAAMQKTHIRPQTVTLDATVSFDNDLQDKLNKLQLEVFSYMNSNVKAPRRQPNKSVAAIKSVGDRLKGKEGRVRGNLMGKRVDQSARSVIAPDACMGETVPHTPITSTSFCSPPVSLLSCASRFSPLASRLSPLASRLSPLASHVPNVTHEVSRSAMQIVAQTSIKLVCQYRSRRHSRWLKKSRLSTSNV